MTKEKKNTGQDFFANWMKTAQKTWSETVGKSWMDASGKAFQEAAQKGTESMMDQMVQAEDRMLALLEETAEKSEEQMEALEENFLKSLDKMPNAQFLQDTVERSQKLTRPLRKALVQSYLAGARFAVESVNRPLRERWKKALFSSAK